ncbi:cytochrome c oxidase assembly factor Coa1 family protein [Microvirga sp. W0021]|uniref:Cytochrome c oxidase assembly factor Coa1 family protein n=1 Tax=Hohaiivirga grylli TaxID=3133970 RepID=A0ABV0BF06_9HYPH
MFGVNFYYYKNFNLSRRGWVIVILLSCLMPIAIFSFIMGLFSDLKKASLQQLMQDSRAQEYLGENIEAGFFVTGNQIGSCAIISVPVRGTKASADIIVSAVKRGDTWIIIEEYLTVGNDRLTIIDREDKVYFASEMRNCQNQS